MEQELNKFKLLVAVIGLAFATSASATVYQYNFGEKISGTGPSEAYFANLSFDDTSSMFTLSLSTQFATIFNTANAFVGSMAVAYEGEGAYPVVTGVVAGGGVSTVTTSSGGGPGGDFDFRYVFGGGLDKLMSGESVSWYSGESIETITSKKGAIKTITIAGFNINNFEEGALHVQGLSNSKSGWYEMEEISPVPEVETYSMMLMGLGLMGFVARRRRNNQV